jgi:hypothetical protein
MDAQPISKAISGLLHGSGNVDSPMAAIIGRVLPDDGSHGGFIDEKYASDF